MYYAGKIFLFAYGDEQRVSSHVSFDRFARISLRRDEENLLDIETAVSFVRNATTMTMTVSRIDDKVLTSPLVNEERGHSTR